MKVSPVLVPSAAQNHCNEVLRVKKTHDGAAAQETDKLELDRSELRFEELLEAAKNSPDVRVDKVESVRKRIEAGEYNVDSGDVAEKIIEQIGR